MELRNGQRRHPIQAAEQQNVPVCDLNLSDVHPLFVQFQQGA